MDNKSMMQLDGDLDTQFDDLVNYCMLSGKISQHLYEEYDVKRGLRDSNGKGVLTGLTEIADVVSYQYDEDGNKVPGPGKLYYQGYDVEDLIKSYQNKRYAFEETTYLLLFGELPTPEQFESFKNILSSLQELSAHFVRDVIMKAPSENLMNALQKSVLTLYSYDENPDDISVPNVLRQSLQLISKLPIISVYAYHSYRHFKFDDALVIRTPDKSMSTAENILQMIRDIKEHCPDWKDKAAITEYLAKILDKKAFDGSGLIYGMGHAVYTESDPREVVLKKYAKKLSEVKGLRDEFKLYETVEKVAARLLMKKRHLYKPVCANVDFYSGFVYTMLGIPRELFTPIFAISRISGWCAHRLEERVNDGKIIRPAYKFVGKHKEYQDIEERN